MNTEELRQKLAEIRAEMGLSLRDLAEELEIAPSTLLRIENGANTSYEIGTRILEWIKQNEDD